MINDVLMMEIRHIKNGRKTAMHWEHGGGREIFPTMNEPSPSQNGNASEYKQEACKKHRTEVRSQERLRFPAENTRYRSAGIIF